MLLTRLANSAKATFWTSPVKDLGPGSAVLASEGKAGAEEDGSTTLSSTTLDWVLVDAKHRALCTLTLTDEGAQEVLAESGVELDDVEQANAMLANILVASCERNGVSFALDKDKTAATVHLKDKIGGVTIDVRLEARVVLEGQAMVSADLLRVFEVFRREPRRENRKRSSQSQGLSTQEATQGSEYAAAGSALAASNVSQVVKAKRKKGLKI